LFNLKPWKIANWEILNYRILNWFHVKSEADKLSNFHTVSALISVKLISRKIWRAEKYVIVLYSVILAKLFECNNFCWFDEKYGEWVATSAILSVTSLTKNSSNHFLFTKYLYCLTFVLEETNYGLLAVKELCQRKWPLAVILV